MLIKQKRGKQWLNSQRRMIDAAHYVGLGACLVVLAALCFGEMGLPRYFDMRDHARQLETEILDLQRGVMGLHSDIDRLEYDPLKIEQLAREQLGYVRKGETVYQLLPETSQDRLRP